MFFCGESINLHTTCMCIKWGNCFSERFSLSSGVRQNGILSSYLFAVYLHDLSVLLNKASPGCYVGNLLGNHLMYADDICCSVRAFEQGFIWLLCR